MRHRVAGRRFDRPTDHRLAMYRNLVRDVLLHEYVQTTEPKAKEIQSLCERVITMGKDGGLGARRRALSFLSDKAVVDKVFTELGPRYAGRPGGYTRIIKLPPRHGDGAPMAKIELVK
ncbi:MAG: 50S ribosomal protein L17 [Chloroflexi bacterium]|nr:50S ribosomal protein L17 [Chloroflexota bacterium]